MSAVNTVLLDLDGVIRHFDPAHVAGVEQQHGLAPGAINRAAFSADLLSRVTTGQITHDAWVRDVATRIANPGAASAWSADRGYVDEAMMEIVAELRRTGTTVAVLTNGTSWIPNDLRQLGVHDAFDAVFNSADIGFAKPDPRAFRYVCDALAVDPAAVFFTDDSESKLAGAIELGMTARRFVSPEHFRTDLAELGIAT